MHALAEHRTLVLHACEELCDEPVVHSCHLDIPNAMFNSSMKHLKQKETGPEETRFCEETGTWSPNFRRHVYLVRVWLEVFFR